MTPPSLRVALLSYRGNPCSGGQGVYVRYLSSALAELGHRVEVFAGPPYPDVDGSVALTKVPSLDLYRPDDPFRTPRSQEFRDAVDVLEFSLMSTAAFPEPLTFGLRVTRLLRGRADDFDVVHDNQSLGYGLLAVARRLPLIATVHHPLAIDRRLELEQAPDAKRRLALRRWYSFIRMQARVARRLPRLIAVSDAAREDIVRELGVERARVSVVPNGVDTSLFRPKPRRAVPGRIVTTASADAPLKGLVHLVEALAKVRTERPADLVVVGKIRPDGAVASAIARFGLEDAVRFERDVGRDRLVELYSEAEVAVVPSLYEGFSLPALEAMACGRPLVATTAGALPEVVGRDGDAALLVPPADPGALALAISTLLDDAALRARLGAAGRARALERFSWRRTAEATVESYARVIPTA